jgi:NAD(P)-dependent dehydrogenase (short-subunit alcohol dehydrogenase family)
VSGFPLHGEKALVTGGGDGIGRGIVLELAAAGADVAVTHLPTPEHRELAFDVTAAVERLGRRAVTIPMDVTVESSVDAGVGQLLREFARLDILVNNAGVMQTVAGLDAPVTDFDRCYDVNVKGIWNVSKRLAAAFREQGGGRIVNVASTAGRRGGAEVPAYAASKAAVLSLTQSMADSFGPHGITVNAVCPGFVRTAMSEGFVAILREAGRTDADDAAAYMSSIVESLPLRRHVTAEDIGNAVVFFASARARSITGQALNVDGGYMMN